MNKSVFLILMFLVFSCQNTNNSKKSNKAIKPDSILVNQPTKIDKIKFIETEKTLNKQLERFRGKTVFIDTWFTSCGSCIKQFKYAEDLENFFNENDIVSLYICFGNAKDKNKWRDLINKHQLSGYHLFLEHKNIVEYKSTFKMNKYKKSLFHVAPRYLIIDKNGNLLDGFAPMPINKQQLIKVFNQYLKK